MTTFQLNGTFASVSVTTTPALLNIPNGSNGIIVTNPDTTNSIFIHLSPIGVAAPSAASHLLSTSSTTTSISGCVIPEHRLPVLRVASPKP